MNIIFLDIDGVMLPFRNHQRIKADLDALRIEVAQKFNDEAFLTMNKFDIGAFCLDFQPESVDYLKRLIKEFDARIVFSTGWRYMGYETLLKLFKILDLDQYIIGETPRYENIDITQYDYIFDQDIPFMFNYYRVVEILEYVKTHDVDNYVALDDMDLSYLGNHFIYIEDGYFDKEHYQQACKQFKSATY